MTTKTKPWISGFCGPDMPKDSHARCDDHPRSDGKACACPHHQTPAGGHVPVDDPADVTVERESSHVPPAGPIPDDPTGFHLDIPEEHYHRHPTSLSQSGAKLILQAPALFDHSRRHPVYKRIFDVGSAAHQEVLGKGAGIVVIQRTTVDKKTGEILEVVDAPDLRSASAQEHQKQIRTEGKIPVTRKEYDHVQAMAEVLAGHKRAMELFTEGDAEVSAFCIDEPTGVMRRARFDFLTSNICVDYKSAESADPWAFARNAVDYGYDIQDAFYLDLLEDLGHPADAFTFVVQQKQAPYLVSVVELDEDSREHGRRRYQRALEVFAECTATGVWPPFVPEDTHQTVRIPDWALRREGIA